MTVRLHLTVDDVANIRFHAEPRPMEDTVAVLRELGTGAAHRHPGLDVSCTAMLTDMVGECTPAFIASDARSLDEGLERLLAAPARDLARDLDDSAGLGFVVPVWARQLLDSRSGRRGELVAAYRHVYCVLVEPYEAVLVDHQVRIHHLHMQRLATHGLGDLLNHLHPSVQWRSPLLSIELGSALDLDLELNGRGVTFQPSAMVTDPSVIHDPQGEFDTTVVYPAGGTGAVSTLLPSATPRALADVLGQTRADALWFLGRNAGSSTSALATGLDVSPASASEQLTLLRAAGLTNRARKGPAVSHTLTQLGWSLLTASRSGEPAAAARRR